MSEASPEAIPNQYIVVFKPHTPKDVRQQHCDWAQSAHSEAAAFRAESGGPELTGVGEKFEFNTLTGYVGSFEENLKNEIEAREEVDFVEPDYVVYTCADVVTQEFVPSWGLGRISSSKKLPDPPPDDLGYTYDATAGADTWAYVIDTGILITHEDFDGRATWGANFSPSSTDTDKKGHGTHVAGTIGGTKYGVAKKCNLIAVKVLGDDGKGRHSGSIKGLEWAVNHAKDNGWIKKSVANMSLGGSRSEAKNKAVDAAVNEGLTVVVSAGNENKDASTKSPASAPLAYTVGSIDITDVRSSFSNYGECVDIFAPGRKITSDFCEPGNTGTQTKNGTSMSTPHVTGLALTIIASDPGKYDTPAAITDAISTLATENTRALSVPEGTTTLIAYNGL